MTSPDTNWLDELNRTLADAPETWPAMVTEHDGIDLAKSFYDAWRPQGARLLAMLAPISDPELADRASWQTRAARVAEQLQARILSHWSGAPERDPRGCSPAHALFMAHAIKNRTDGVDSDTKACRWLGWLQCLCAVHRFATLEEMKLMNVNSKNASEGVADPPDEQSPEQKAAILPREPAPTSTIRDKTDEHDFANKRVCEQKPGGGFEWKDAPGSTESDAAFVERMASPYGYFVAESCGLKECGVEWDRLISIARRRAVPLDHRHGVVERDRVLEEAWQAVAQAAWRHEGNDAYSQGLDKGARDQVDACCKVIAVLRTLPSTKPSPSDLIRCLDHLLHDMCDEGGEDDRWHAEEAHELIHDAARHLAPEPEIRECARKEAAERREAIEALRERRDAKPIVYQYRLKNQNVWFVLPPEAADDYKKNKALVVRPLYAASPKPEPAPRPAADLCKHDNRPCYVGAGTEDAHFRCGTSACGPLKLAPRSVAWPTEEDVERAVAEFSRVFHQEVGGTEKAVRAALSAIAPPAPTWCFDMAVAPRDGTRILGETTWGQNVIFWDKSLIFGENWFAPSGSGGGGQLLRPRDVLAWMPLPAPPARETGR